MSMLETISSSERERSKGQGLASESYKILNGKKYFCGKLKGKNYVFREIALNSYLAKVKITNILGMHARPSGLFAKTASEYLNCEIYAGSNKPVEPIFQKDNFEGKDYVDGKSIMSLISLCLVKNTYLYIKTEGENAKEASKSLVSLVHSGFGEE